MNSVVNYVFIVINKYGLNKSIFQSWNYIFPSIVLIMRHLESEKRHPSYISQHLSDMYSDPHALPIPGGQGLCHTPGMWISICHIVGSQETSSEWKRKLCKSKMLFFKIKIKGSDPFFFFFYRWEHCLYIFFLFHNTRSFSFFFF